MSAKRYPPIQAAKESGFSTRALTAFNEPDKDGRVFFRPSLGDDYSENDIKALQKMYSIPHSGRRGNWLRLIADRICGWDGYDTANEAFLHSKLKKYNGFDVWQDLGDGRERSCLRLPGFVRPSDPNAAAPWQPCNSNDPTVKEMAAALYLRKPAVFRRLWSLLNPVLAIWGVKQLSKLPRRNYRSAYFSERKAQARLLGKKVGAGADNEANAFKKVVFEWAYQQGVSFAKAAMETKWSEQNLRALARRNVYPPSIPPPLDSRTHGFFTRDDIKTLARLRQCIRNQKRGGQLWPEIGESLRKVWGCESIKVALDRLRPNYTGYDIHHAENGERVSCYRRPGMRILTQAEKKRVQLWGEYITQVYEQEDLVGKSPHTQKHTLWLINTHILPTLKNAPLTDRDALQRCLDAAPKKVEWLVASGLSRIRSSANKRSWFPKGSLPSRAIRPVQPPPQPRPPRLYTLDELRDSYAEFGHNEVLQQLWVLIFCLGLLPREGVGVKWECWNLEPLAGQRGQEPHSLWIRECWVGWPGRWEEAGRWAERVLPVPARLCKQAADRRPSGKNDSLAGHPAFPDGSSLKEPLALRHIKSRRLPTGHRPSTRWESARDASMDLARQWGFSPAELNVFYGLRPRRAHGEFRREESWPKFRAFVEAVYASVVEGKDWAVQPAIEAAAAPAVAAVVIDRNQYVLADGSLNPEVRKALKTLRRNRRWTQAYAGEILRLTERQYNRIELGHTKCPSDWTLDAMIDLLEDPQGAEEKAKRRSESPLHQP